MSVTGWLGFLLSAAFFAGLFGGVHCAAMCGGIVAACVARRADGAFAWRRVLAYNMGRITSYAAAGAVAGALGHAGMALRGTALTHHLLLALAGSAMIVIALYISGFQRAVRMLEAAGAVMWRYVHPWSRAFLPADTALRAVGLGLVWGWLPCGMVYAALMTAVASADAGWGAAIMLAFGLGTLPNLLAVAMLADRLRGALRGRVHRLTAAAALGTLGIVALAGATGFDLFSANSLFCLVPGAITAH
jgi:sulfite exporter TauE/SafE